MSILDAGPGAKLVHTSDYYEIECFLRHGGDKIDDVLQ